MLERERIVVGITRAQPVLFTRAAAKRPIIAAPRYAINPFVERGLVRRRVPSKKHDSLPSLARGLKKEIRRPRRRSKERVGNGELFLWPNDWAIYTLFHRKTEQKGEKRGKRARTNERWRVRGWKLSEEKGPKSEKKGGKKNSWTIE